ncbi:hypothetical protein B0H13DRAFT_2411702 [Mycena leptocephala]|nr:hypothetical protein B0H13DRAFT_2411702 [Mycena leptocephala]
MTDHYFNLLWSDYTTWPNPSLGQQTLHRMCSMLTKHVLQPSDIILAGGGYVLHSDLASPLNNVIPIMIQVLRAATKHCGLRCTSSLSETDVHILTCTTGLRIPATLNQIVLHWITLIDKLYVAMADLKTFRVGYSIPGSLDAHAEQRSRISNILSALPPSLRVKLPKGFLLSHGIMLLPAAANHAASRTTGVHSERSYAPPAPGAVEPQERSTSTVNVAGRTGTVSERPGHARLVYAPMRSVHSQDVVPEYTKPELDSVDKYPTCKSSSLPPMTASVVDLLTLTGVDLPTADAATSAGARPEWTTPAKVPVEKGTNSSADAHTLGLSREIARTQIPHTQASLLTTRVSALVASTVECGVLDENLRQGDKSIIPSQGSEPLTTRRSSVVPASAKELQPALQPRSHAPMVSSPCTPVFVESESQHLRRGCDQALLTTGRRVSELYRDSALQSAHITPSPRFPAPALTIANAVELGGLQMAKPRTETSAGNVPQVKKPTELEGLVVDPQVELGGLEEDLNRNQERDLLMETRTLEDLSKASSQHAPPADVSPLALLSYAPTLVIDGSAVELGEPNSDLPKMDQQDTRFGVGDQRTLQEFARENGIHTSEPWVPELRASTSSALAVTNATAVKLGGLEEDIRALAECNCVRHGQLLTADVSADPTLPPLSPPGIKKRATISPGDTAQTVAGESAEPLFALRSDMPNVGRTVLAPVFQAVTLSMEERIPQPLGDSSAKYKAPQQCTESLTIDLEDLRDRVPALPNSLAMVQCGGLGPHAAFQTTARVPGMYSKSCPRDLALKVVHGDLSPKSPAPVLAIANAVELGGLRGQMAEPRMTASLESVPRVHSGANVVEHEGLEDSSPMDQHMKLASEQHTSGNLASADDSSSALCCAPSSASSPPCTSPLYINISVDFEDAPWTSTRSKQRHGYSNLGNGSNRSISRPLIPVTESSRLIFHISFRLDLGILDFSYLYCHLFQCKHESVACIARARHIIRIWPASIFAGVNWPDKWEANSKLLRPKNTSRWVSSTPFALYCGVAGLVANSVGYSKVDEAEDDLFGSGFGTKQPLRSSFGHPRLTLSFAFSFWTPWTPLISGGKQVGLKEGFWYGMYLKFACVCARFSSPYLAGLYLVTKSDLKYPRSGSFFGHGYVCPVHRALNFAWDCNLSFVYLQWHPEIYPMHLLQREAGAQVQEFGVTISLARCWCHLRCIGLTQRGTSGCLCAHGVGLWGTECPTPGHSSLDFRTLWESRAGWCGYAFKREAFTGALSKELSGIVSSLATLADVFRVELLSRRKGEKPRWAVWFRKLSRRPSALQSTYWAEVVQCPLAPSDPSGACPPLFSLSQFPVAFQTHADWRGLYWVFGCVPKAAALVWSHLAATFVGGIGGMRPCNGVKSESEWNEAEGDSEWEWSRERNGLEGDSEVEMDIPRGRKAVQNFFFEFVTFLFFPTIPSLSTSTFLAAQEWGALYSLATSHILQSLVEYLRALIEARATSLPCLGTTH